MRLLARGLAALLAVTLLALPGTSQAARLTVSDPVGDGSFGPRLDITGVTVSNGDRAIRVRSDFAQVARGDLIAFLQPRGQRGSVRVVSEYRPGRDSVRTYLLDGRRDKRLRCPGLRASWDAAADSATVVLPSRCLAGGDYGAVRAFVLTEIGPDADIAPDDGEGSGPWTAYVARG